MRLWTCSACWTGPLSSSLDYNLITLLTVFNVVELFVAQIDLGELLTVFNVVQLFVAHIDLGELNENAPLNIFSTVAGNGRRYLGCAKGGNRETGDWKRQTPVVGLLRQPLT